MQRDGSAPGLSTGGRSGLDPSLIETMGERGGIAGMMTGAPMRLGKSGRRGSDKQRSVPVDGHFTWRIRIPGGSGTFCIVGCDNNRGP